MRLSEIVEALRDVPGVSGHPAFWELEKISTIRPGIRFVQWYRCNACDSPAHDICATTTPGGCKRGTHYKPEWKVIEYGDEYDGNGY